MSYVNKDDFLNFSGLDLEIEFANGNYDVEDMPQVFINRVEDNAIAVLKNHYDNENFDNKVNKFLNEFKKGMCYQILDKLKHGETPTLDKTAKTIWTNIGLCNLRRY